MSDLDETEAGARLAAPISAEDVVGWLDEAAEMVRTGEVPADELIRLLGELRAASMAFANASDWALLAAREAGASLREVATAFGKGYVRSPAARLEKLHREALTSDEFLELVHRRGGESHA
ncbi:MAG: hypothetical protein GEU98_09575 [Pseudonocardiaceae bacterium]|nr:hypothetical protein [Pseudonocardiaceae bacterium]